MSDSSVKVAVRVRPFNQREIDNKSECIVEMNGTSTVLKGVGGEKDTKFTFDYSYWSHNKDDPHFADNTMVFNDLGQLVLDNAFEGFNTSLFAYGQTGSGKSYSMVGYGEDKGIIPKVCDAIFQRIDAAKNNGSKINYQVECTMMEIYNEELRDLLNPAKNPPGGLKIRDHPKTGPYVEDLTPVLVNSYKEVDKLMEKGTAARTVASTNMNKTSSRAHTLFSLIFTQSTINEANGNRHDKVSKINLVDLAGSEKIKSTGATGQTMKEGININLSLTNLGNVISALADRCSGKNPKAFVPYRNSVLTYIMKESLGGNSKTIMIAAISPASINHDESLSTLRYADRAKRIQNKAIVNEDPNVRLIKELKSEIESLKAQLSNGGLAPSVETADGEEGTEKADPEEIKRIEEALAQSQKIIQELSLSNEEKELRRIQLEKERDEALSKFGLIQTENEKNEFNRLKHIHLVNLNEDPQMADKLVYPLMEQTVTVGAATENESDKPGIPLSGIGIGRIHASFSIENFEHYKKSENNNGVRVYVEPRGRDYTVYINGVQIREKSEVKHSDRLVFGMHHFFRLVLPDPSNLLDTPQQIDWRMAVEELADKLALEKASKIRSMERQHEEEEQQKRLKEFEEKMRQQRVEYEQQLQKERDLVHRRETELQQQLKELKEGDTATIKRTENELKALQAKTAEIAAREKKYLEEMNNKEQQYKKQLEDERAKYQELQRQKLQLEEEQKKKVQEYEKMVEQTKSDMEHKLNREREAVKQKEEELRRQRVELENKLTTLTEQDALQRKSIEEKLNLLINSVEEAKIREQMKTEKYTLREQQYEEQLREERRRLEEVQQKSLGVLQINEVLTRLIPILNEANFISNQMHVDTDLELKFDPVTQNVDVLVRNEASDWEAIWSVDTFISKVTRMREVYELYKKKDPSFELGPHNDPFFDAEAASKAGKSYSVRTNTRSTSGNDADFPVPISLDLGTGFDITSSLLLEPIGYNPHNCFDPFSNYLPYPTNNAYSDPMVGYGSQGYTADPTTQHLQYDIQLIQQQLFEARNQAEQVLADNAQLMEENNRLKTEIEENRRRKQDRVAQKKEKKRLKQEKKRLKCQQKGKEYVPSDSDSSDADDFDSVVRTQKKLQKKLKRKNKEVVDKVKENKEKGKDKDKEKSKEKDNKKEKPAPEVPIVTNTTAPIIQSNVVSNTNRIEINNHTNVISTASNSNANRNQYKYVSQTVQTTISGQEYPRNRGRQRNESKICNIQ